MTGVLLQPRIVKEIKNVDTGAITEIPVKEVRQVLSKKTAQEVKSLMESVVTDGSGRHAAVSGYSIGGKTGTSEPPPNNQELGYVASYVAISPIEDTQIVLLLTLYDPPAGNHQGGTLAGPIVGQMLTEILPYLGVPSDSTQTSTTSDNSTMVPDIRNKTVTEAEKILKDAGFNVKTYIEGDPNSVLVVDQTPKPGSYLVKDALVVIYGQGSDVATSVPVPDLKGKSAAEATSILKGVNLNINIEGSGSVISQDYIKDEPVPEGTIIRVTLKQNLSYAQ